MRDVLGSQKKKFMKDGFIILKIIINKLRPVVLLPYIIVEIPMYSPTSKKAGRKYLYTVYQHHK